MLTTLILLLLSALGLFGVDYYVYRNWARFAQYRRWARRWTLPPYRVLMVVMPFALPAYLALDRWLGIEPAWLRGLLIGFWGVYYGPKALVAVGILVKDLLRFTVWLFQWFQQELLGGPKPSTEFNQPPALALPPAPVVAAPVSALDLTDMKRMPRRDFLQQLGWSAASVPAVIVGYGVFRRLYDYEVYEIDVPIPGLPRQFDGLTIAQLSDLHAGSFFSTRPMHDAVDVVNDLRPDLVAITGDYVNGDAAELPLVLPGLDRLQAPLGVYGSLGNHDHYASVREVIDGVRHTTVDLLVNEHRDLRIDGATLHLVGTDNTGYYQHFGDLPGALRGHDRDADGAYVLMAHDPTFWDSHVRRHHPEIDLTLGGHTHGGQFGIEAGPVRWSLASMAYERWAGLYREPGAGERPQFLYVNRGLGTVGPPLRMGIRPEITLLTLRRAPAVAQAAA